MPREFLHRFEREGKRFAIDPETCFCFECDEISWDVLDHYPHTSVNRIIHLLGGKHNPVEISEVVGELEWLRATRSILTPPKKEDLLKTYEVERGLKRITIAMPPPASPIQSVNRSWFGRNQAVQPGEGAKTARAAIHMLLARSQGQKDLHIEFDAGGRIAEPEVLAELCAHAFNAAKLAGKTLAIAVRLMPIAVSKPPEALAGHTLGVKVEFREPGPVASRLRALAKAGENSLARWLKLIESEDASTPGRIIVSPNHPEFGGVVEALDAVGFAHIELDLDSAYVAHPDLEPQAMLEGLGASAEYYARRLLEHHYFRLDPMASLFHRIYTGTPQRRSDWAGTWELAVDDTGVLYPSRLMIGCDALRFGSVADGSIDEEKVRTFEDVGSLTTSVCIRCWARNLCGGGPAAVHHALAGSFRTPHEPWCDAQRAWMMTAVSAFQQLSSAGVQFDRVYTLLTRQQKPSLFTLARAALAMTIGARPIEEADAGMLTHWENWNEAAYFLFNETGLLLATRYDREMDSLHPRGIEQELVLTRKNGEPMGLLKVRPERFQNAAQAWLYLHDEADYASDATRRGFRAILKEAGGQQSVRRLTIPASSKEQGLQAFLEAVGFTQLGTLRETLYLHGAYHDVHLFDVTLDRL